MAKTYPSKVDAWLFLVLLIAPAATVAVIVAGLMSGETGAVIGGIGSTIVVAGIYAGLVVPMRYTIDEDHLLLRAGLLKARIPYDRLDKGTLTSNPVSGMALSLRRIQLAYRKASGSSTRVLISPPDREAFLRDVAEASGQHTVSDDGTLTRLDGDA